MQKIFFSLILQFLSFSEQHRENVRVKLTKFDKSESGEKYNYVSDTLFEWPRVQFVILLSCYFVLRESDFL